MKEQEINNALTRSGLTNLRAVIVRSGGWIGGYKRTLLLSPPSRYSSNIWSIEEFSSDGILIQRLYVEAENILGLSFVPDAKETLAGRVTPET